MAPTVYLDEDIQTKNLKHATKAFLEHNSKMKGAVWQMLSINFETPQFQLYHLN